ncbi:uncharacterized protein LAESUDRAFT_720869 [Laetiporus sulphureus 93-53]|uniref:Ricin B lectin domain-containing protein n=1 Tax=Laetiporus sulphureus 93-53 TaxID=1314785 RepID=A0A165HE81_9APHY|nr:uncharacterized protein LAESUDRAFT_720869 [Laetiporus sulphureus 93-53]KZT11619.1 hypothetical protein LAESUDRAFT_720869 [Laetiporus sulphureus 93-53]
MGFKKGIYRIQNEMSKEYVTLAKAKDEEGTRLATTNKDPETDPYTKWILTPIEVVGREDYYAIRTGAEGCYVGLPLQTSIHNELNHEKPSPVIMDFNPGPYDVALTSKATHVFHISQHGGVYLISAHDTGGAHLGLGKKGDGGHALAVNDDTAHHENHWNIRKV